TRANRTRKGDPLFASKPKARTELVRLFPDDPAKGIVAASMRSRRLNASRLPARRSSKVAVTNNLADCRTHSVADDKVPQFTEPKKRASCIRRPTLASYSATGRDDTAT